MRRLAANKDHEEIEMDKVIVYFSYAGAAIIFGFVPFVAGFITYNQMTKTTMPEFVCIIVAISAAILAVFFSVLVFPN